LRLAPLDLDYARIYEVDLGKLREAPPSGLPLRYLLLEETGRWDDGATSSARAADERGILLVGSSPSSPDRQAEFDAWFDDVHVDDILRVPGMLSARRYRRVAGAASSTGIDEDHVVIYEVAAPDLGSVLGGLAATRADRSISDVLQLDPLPRSFLGAELEGE
jgi:hypothetical protein